MKLFSLLALTGLALADTCSLVQDNMDIDVEHRFSLTYSTANLNYWSTLCSQQHPSCMLWPNTPEQLSQIIGYLAASNETFAIKSGGHNPNTGFSSVNGGPLINLENFKEVTLDTEAKTVRIGAGQKWGHVVEVLDGTRYAVVSGRMSDVGVGGFMLGGGLSFLSSQYGWAASNVVEYEVVLMNGTITTASPTKNSDLFKVLRGGGNNFAIVTTYIVKAHPIGEIWGGNYIFADSEETTTKLLAALRDFTEYYPDPKAALILSRQKSIELVNIWTMFLFYDGATPPAGIFDNFTAIGPVVDTTKTRSYRDLLDANDWGSTKGLVFTIGTETFANPDAEHGAEVFSSIQNAWYQVAKGVQDIIGIVAVIAYQPIPKYIASAAKELGGDLLDLSDDTDRLFLDVNYGHLLPAQYDRIEEAMVNTIDGIHQVVTEFEESGKLADVHNPLFMNDGFHTQDIFARYTDESHQLAKDVAAAYDPNGILKTRTGGFKPQV